MVSLLAKEARHVLRLPSDVQCRSTARSYLLHQPLAPSRQSRSFNGPMSAIEEP